MSWPRWLTVCTIWPVEGELWRTHSERGAWSLRPIKGGYCESLVRDAAVRDPARYGAKSIETRLWKSIHRY
jgi:hypothetical protein